MQLFRGNQSLEGNVYFISAQIDSIPSNTIDPIVNSNYRKRSPMGALELCLCPLRCIVCLVNLIMDGACK